MLWAVRVILMYIVPFLIGFVAAQVWMLLMVKHEVAHEASRFLWKVMGGSEN